MADSAMPSVLSKVAMKELVSEQQIDAVMRVYTRDITDERFGAQFPQLSHLKKSICAAAA